MGSVKDTTLHPRFVLPFFFFFGNYPILLPLRPYRVFKYVIILGVHDKTVHRPVKSERQIGGGFPPASSVEQSTAERFRLKTRKVCFRSLPPPIRGCGNADCLHAIPTR